ncbi:MAG TPA: energy transducer TonB [Steroidobacteraceae bacterium]|nr:energy transducer TonB [Steroidobacteraceae bacterium]
MESAARQSVAAPHGAPLRARRFEAVIVSKDDALLLELGPLLGDRYRTRMVDDLEAVPAPGGSSRWFLIFDASARTDARAALARLEQQHPHVPVVVLDDDARLWSGARARGALVAVVPRGQLDEVRLQPALQACEARLERIEPASAAAAAPAPASASTPAPDSASALAAAPAGPAASRPIARALPWLAAAVVTLACAAGLGAWLLHRSPAAVGAAAPAAPAAQAPASAPGPQSVADLLSAARIAFHDQRELPRPDAEPHGDSALELYTQVMAADPGNEEAADGIRRLFSIGKARIQGDLAAGRLEDAARLVALFRAAGIDAGALQDSEAAIAAARPRLLAAHAQELIAAGDFAAAEQALVQLTALGADRAVTQDLRRRIDAARDAARLDRQLAGMAAQVQAAIDAGALLQPADDNARTRLQAMRNLARSHPQTLSAQHAVQAALLARAAAAAQQQQFDAAQRLLAAAADLGTAADVSAAKRQLQAAMDQAAQRAAASAAAARAQAAAARPAAGVAPAPQARPAPAPGYIAARTVQPLQVDYPDSAQNLRGSVTLEFTLRPDGRAAAVRVITATPAGIFDRAAIDAVLGGHFDTQQLDGQARRARIKINFKPG